MYRGVKVVFAGELPSDRSIKTIWPSCAYLVRVSGQEGDTLFVVDVVRG
jgi:hypothetical protein